MNIGDLVPTLQPMVENLNTQFRFICFFILTGSIIVRVGSGSTDVAHLTRPIITNILICGFLATLPFWFNLIRDSFWNIAVSIRPQITGSVDGVGASLMQLLEPPDDGVNWIDVGSSLMKAIQYAVGWMVIWFAGMIQLPMMIIQYVMECLCYLFLPIAISLLAFETTKGLAIRYIQQTLSVLAWPIGFAIVDLVGASLLGSVTSVVSAGAVGVGVVTKFTPVSQVIAGIVALWLILGSLATPIMMQMLFCSGTPLSSGVGQSIQLGMSLAGVLQGLFTGVPVPPSNPSSPNPGSSNPPSTNPPSPPSPLPPSLPNPTQPGTDSSPSGPSAPKTPPPSPLNSNGFMQTPRGSLAVGKFADQITPAQAQSFANQTGSPFTQALSDGQIRTYLPNQRSSENPKPV